MRNSFKFAPIIVILFLMSILSASVYAQDGFECYIVTGNAVIFKYKGTAENLIIPNTINGYPVTAIHDGAFAYCQSLTSVVLPESITEIRANAFVGCENLMTIDVPDKVTEIWRGAFERCTKLTTVIFNSPNTKFEETLYSTGLSGIYEVTPTFYKCISLNTIYGFSGSMQERYARENGKTFVPVAKVQLNGQIMVFDPLPRIINDRTMVPVYKIAESLKAQVIIDNDCQAITLEKDNVTIILQVDNPVITVNEETLVLDVPSQIVNDVYFLPIRAVSESLGAMVSWDDENKTVIIDVGLTE